MKALYKKKRQLTLINKKSYTVYSKATTFVSIKTNDA